MELLPVDNDDNDDDDKPYHHGLSGMIASAASVLTPNDDYFVVYVTRSGYVCVQHTTTTTIYTNTDGSCSTTVNTTPYSILSNQYQSATRNCCECVAAYHNQRVAVVWSNGVIECYTWDISNIDSNNNSLMILWTLDLNSNASIMTRPATTLPPIEDIILACGTRRTCLQFVNANTLCIVLDSNLFWISERPKQPQNNGGISSSSSSSYVQLQSIPMQQTYKDKLTVCAVRGDSLAVGTCTGTVTIYQVQSNGTLSEVATSTHPLQWTCTHLDWFSNNKLITGYAYIDTNSDKDEKHRIDSPVQLLIYDASSCRCLAYLNDVIDFLNMPCHGRHVFYTARLGSLLLVASNRSENICVVDSRNWKVIDMEWKTPITKDDDVVYPTGLVVVQQQVLLATTDGAGTAGTIYQGRNTENEDFFLAVPEQIVIPQFQMQKVINDDSIPAVVNDYSQKQDAILSSPNFVFGSTPTTPQLNVESCSFATSIFATDNSPFTFGQPTPSVFGTSDLYRPTLSSPSITTPALGTDDSAPIGGFSIGSFSKHPLKTRKRPTRNSTSYKTTVPFTTSNSHPFSEVQNPYSESKSDNEIKRSTAGTASTNSDIFDKIPRV